jgi:hypothetical protein
MGSFVSPRRAESCRAHDWAGPVGRPRVARDQRNQLAAAPHSHSSPAAGAEDEYGPVDSARGDSGGGAAGRPARPGGRPAASPGVAARRRRRPRGPPAGFGGWPDSETPVRKGEVARSCPLRWGAVDQLGDQVRPGGSWPPRCRRGESARSWCRLGAAASSRHVSSKYDNRRRSAAGGESGVLGMREDVGVFYRMRCRPEGLVKGCCACSISQGRAGAGAVGAMQGAVTQESAGDSHHGH